MVDVLDSSIRVFQTAFPSVMQYLGNAKDREAKAAREEEKRELAQIKAQLEVLVIKNQELTQSNMQLEVFKDLIFGLAGAVIVFVGMALTSEGA